ncbi:SPOR domain-containing protein [Jannaschia sp. 2305UL9-9]|uniref:SPOR domain-containing protein n=1 Tax=Jannaschia sp. 2305UL9-9 TaxID=3121638 RepID=UPI0035282D0A
MALLAACQPGGTFGGGGGSDATRGSGLGTSVQLIERDIEAPEVFQANDRALWDGRPSLGGVWVAAPDVRDPERVIIRNEANGKFVIGALFKRERGNPGPALQLSSDAAAALGIIAGAPTTIDVVALRREEVPDPAAAPTVSAPDAVADAQPPVAEDRIIQASAAPETPAQPEAAAAVPERTAAASIASQSPETDDFETAAADAASPQESAPKRQNWFQRTFGKRNADPAPLPTPASLDGDADIEMASTAAPSSVSATSLDAPRVAATPARGAVPRTGSLDRAYIQIGIFSVEQNARDTATSLSNAGVLPTVLEQESRGRTFWRVIVGPSMTASDRAAVLRKAKSLGFTDAYAVSG